MGAITVRFTDDEEAILRRRVAELGRGWSLARFVHDTTVHELRRRGPRRRMEVAGEGVSGPGGPDSHSAPGDGVSREVTNPSTSTPSRPEPPEPWSPPPGVEPVLVVPSAHRHKAKRVLQGGVAECECGARRVGGEWKEASDG